MVNDKDELIVAGHPKPLVFVQHEKDHHVRSPSEIVIFRNPTSSKLSYYSLELDN